MPYIFQNKSKSSIIFYADDGFELNDSDRLLRMLFSLKKRFDLDLFLVLNLVEELSLFNLAILNESYASEVHISGNSLYAFSDAIAVAMRVKTEYAYVCPLNYLQLNFNEIVRLIFDIENSNPSDQLIMCGNGGIFRVHVNYLRNLNFDYVGNSLNYFLNKIKEKNSDPLKNLNLENAKFEIFNSNQRQVFISSAAVDRMFGLQRLIESSLMFDGSNLSNYSKIFLIKNDAILHYSEHKQLIPVVKEIKHEIDIYPGPSVQYKTDFGDSDLNIPRTILRLKTKNNLISSSILENSRVGYIMSNYNKCKYIVASIFSLLSQFHKNIHIYFWDDVSSDNSKLIFGKFLNFIDLSVVNITWNFGETNRGTYWIRNDIIYRSKKDIDYYFINDSDDYSSLRRTEFQLNYIASNPSIELVMVDIVRTDGSYKLLSMNNEIERYGTATTAFRSSLIDKIGFFQVFRKNTDTEFIDRVKTFIGDKAAILEHYPGLFQTFDGTNLTSDIYTITDGGSTIEVSTGLRGVHDLLFRKHHSRLTLSTLPSHFSFPESTIPGEFKRLDKSFFVEGYVAFDSVCLFLTDRLEISNELFEQIKKSGYLIIYKNNQEDYIFEKKDSEIFSTDLDFIRALSAYLKSYSFYGYIMSSNYVHNKNELKKSPSSFLKKNLSSMVHTSKCNGDKFIYDSTGSVLSRSLFSISNPSELIFFAPYNAIAYG